MTEVQKEYYHKMLSKGRLMPLFDKDRLGAFITFYITNDEKKYTESDSWDVLDDNPDGKICYLAQLITDKDPKNPSLSYQAWHEFKEYIKLNFPLVKTLCWRRWDKKNFVVK